MSGSADGSVVQVPPSSVVAGPSRRNRRYEGVQAPYSGGPPCYISTIHGPRLQDEILKDIAYAVSSLDTLILVLHTKVLEISVSGGLTLYGIDGSPVEELRVVKNALQQIEDVGSGRQQFSESYLKGRELLKYWSQARAFYSQFLNLDVLNPGNVTFRGSIIKQLNTMEQLVLRLPDLLLEAVTQGKLTEDDRDAIRMRWLQLDQILNELYDCTGTDREALSWPEISATFRRASITTTLSAAPSKAILTSASSTPVRNESSSDWISTSMWLTFITTVIAALPTFALAWQYSQHMPGTTHDADFWFMVQACTMQFLGLLTMGIPMWKGKELSGHSWYWTWAFKIVALGCTIAAPFAYCKAPTEWSSFLGIVAGALQVFVTLQITLLADAGGKESEGGKGAKQD